MAADICDEIPENVKNSISRDAPLMGEKACVLILCCMRSITTQ
jgi:hypothetical protein